MSSWSDFHGFSRGEPEPVVGEVRFNMYGDEMIKEWWDGEDWRFACNERGCFELGDTLLLTLSGPDLNLCPVHLKEFFIKKKSTSNILYRHFDFDNCLLYIGITNDISNRWRANKKSQWRNLVTKTTYEYFDNRESLLAGEREAIANERPRFNITHAVHRHGGLETLD